MSEIVYKKLHKKNLFSKVSANSSLIKYGVYALKVVASGILTPTQVEAARRVLSRKTKRIGKIIIRVSFNFPVTKKPLLSRMGKGSGPIKYWIAIVPKGTIIIEFTGITNRISILALKASSFRLPLKTVIFGRHVFKKSLGSSNR